MVEYLPNLVTDRVSLRMRLCFEKQLIAKMTLNAIERVKDTPIIQQLFELVNG